MPEMSDLLARCLEEVESGRAADEVLAQYGDAARELAPLVEVGMRLRASAHPLPSAAFREASRARLLARIGATSNGHANGHANGVGDLNGHAPNGHAPNGHAPNGHAANGHANGHIANGH